MKKYIFIIFLFFFYFSNAQEYERFSENIEKFDGHLSYADINYMGNTPLKIKNFDSLLIDKKAIEKHFDFLQDTLNTTINTNSQDYSDTITWYNQMNIVNTYFEDLMHFCDKISCKLLQVYDENKKPLYPQIYCYSVCTSQECYYITLESFQKLGEAEVEITYNGFDNYDKKEFLTENTNEKQGFITYKGYAKNANHYSHEYFFDIKINDLEMLNGMEIFSLDEENNWQELFGAVEIIVENPEEIKKNVQLPQFFTIKEALKKEIKKKGALNCKMIVNTDSQTSNLTFLFGTKPLKITRIIKVKAR